MQDNINIEKEKKIDPLKTKMGKTYLKGLKIAVETGAISIVILQRKLEVGYVIGGQILDWMIEKGYVRDDKGYLKTTLMTQEEFDELLQRTGVSLKTKRERQRTVDDALYKACLRLVIKKNHVSEKMLKDAFAIGSVRAIAVISKMDMDGYLGGFKNLQREILITKEDFKELYGEDL